MRGKFLQWFKSNYGLLALLAIAMILRVYGNGFGLPDEFHIDETHFVPRAIRFGTGDLNPHWFYYPPLYMYMLFSLYSVYYVYGRLVGIFGSAGAFGMQYFLDPTAFYLIGRTLTAALGAGTVWLTYALGTRAYSRAAGFAAAIMLAFCFLHVEHSHYITSDVPMTFMVTLCLYLVWRYMEAPRARLILCAGLAAGLGMALKYTAVLAVPICGIAMLLEWLFRDKKHEITAACGATAPPEKKKFSVLALALVLLGTGAAAGFIIGCPWIILDPKPVIADVMSTNRNIQGTWLGQEQIHSMWTYVLTDFLRPGMGLPLLLLSGAGLAWAAVRRRAADWLLAGFAIMFYLWMAHYQHYGYARYWVAALPPLFILCGRLLEDAAMAIPKLRLRAFDAAGLAAMALVAVSAVQAVSFDRDLNLDNTRTLARQWFFDNVPPHSRVAVELHGPMLKGDKQSLIDFMAPARYASRHISETMQFDELNTSPRPWAEISVTNKKYHFMALEKSPFLYYAMGVFSLAEYPLDFYVDEKYEYLVATDAVRERYMEAPSRYPTAVAFYKRLERDCPPPPGGPACELAAKFVPVPGRFTGVPVYIYRLNIK